MKIIVAAIAIAVLAVTAAGCSVFGIHVGSGPIETEDYDYRDFDQVQVSHNFEFDISRADTYKVSVSVRQNLVEDLDISRSGRTLFIRFKSGNYTNTDARAVINMPEITRLEISGASRGKVTGFQSENRLDIVSSGASKLDLDMGSGDASLEISGASRAEGTLRSGNISMNISGASQCKLNGSAADGDIEVSGASKLHASEFEMQRAEVEASGASEANVLVKGRLDLEASGASTINYYGNPELGRVDVSGASQIHSK